MKTFQNLKTRKREGTEAGIDYRQLMCAVLYNAVLILEYSATNEHETTICKKCHKKIADKWLKECPKCGTPIDYMENLVNAVTFCESEFAMLLCSECDIDYNSYIKVAKRHFLEMPKDRQRKALNEAKKWWEHEINEDSRIQS